MLTRRGRNSSFRRCGRRRAFDKALAEAEKRIGQLTAQLSGSETEKQLAISEGRRQTGGKLAEAERRIEQLKAQLGSSETEKQLAVSEAVRRKEKGAFEQAAEVAELKNRLANQETESRLKAQSMQREYEGRLKQKDELIEYYKDFKARQSTKMIGESLEQHCLSQFNALRMTALSRRLL